MAVTPGQMLSHYRIGEKIGEGGMGEVWRAEDTRLGRQVALKVLPGDAAADPGRLSRFELEAKAVAALNHPNIVTLFSVEQADGIRFLTMELVEGRSLRARIREDGMAVGEFLEVALPMTDAIAVAHARGIVHRDLKPDNVMLSSEGRVKVLDFGLAKLRAEETLLPEDSSLAPTQTAAGVLLGTLAYMSPEQAQGEPADARSDVFALGTLLFEMSTGRRPFRGKNQVAMISSLLKDPTPSLSGEPGVPARLDRIIRRCLEKEPGARYPSAREVHDDLSVLRDELNAAEPMASADPRVAGPGSEPTEVAVASRPRIRWLGLAGLAAVLAVALLAWMLRGDAGRAPPSPPVEAGPSLAILPLLAADDDSESQAFADGIHDDLILQASRIGALKTISRTSVMRYRESDRALGDIAAELGVSAIMEGSVRRSGRRVRVNVKLIDIGDEGVLWGDTYDRELTAQNIFAMQSEIVGQVAAALETALSSSEREAIAETPTGNLQAYTQYRLGMSLDRETSDESNLTPKVAAFEAATRLDPEMALGWARLSIAHMQLYWRGVDRSGERREMSREALEQAAAIRPDLAEVAMARGFYHYWGFRDYPAALEAFEQAEQGLPNDASLIAAKSFVQRRLGLWEESLATLKRARALDPLNLYLVQNLTNTYWVLRRWDEAFGVVAEAEQLSPGDRWVASAPAALELHQGNPAPILALHASGTANTVHVPPAFRLARDFDGGLEFANSLPAEPRLQQIGWTSRDLLRGEFLSLAGRTTEARAALQRCHDELVTLLEDHPHDPRLHSAMGLTLALLGEASPAVSAARAAVDLLPYRRDAMDAGVWAFDLAAVQAIAGHREAAVASLDRYLGMPGYHDIGFIAADPRFDSLREEPAYQALLLRHGAR